MELTQAFRIQESVRLAFVGAGGKTSALYRLAHELARPEGKGKLRPPVLVSTTTHLGEEQCLYADRHLEINHPEDLNSLARDFPAGVTLVTGTYRESGRISGLQDSLLNALHQLAQEQDVPLLLEADGSRTRPLKAPALHEPAIPDWVDMVVVVAGLSGLGKPLHDAWVHRPEQFAELSNLSLGASIHPETLTGVLLHPQGGLKGIPPAARRIVLLNQADTAELQAVANSMASRLLEAFQLVVVAALNPTQNGVAGREAGTVHATHERVAGILLAAGGSERLGQAKQLLIWQGKPLVRHVAEIGLSAGLEPLIVVTGAAAAEVGEALEGLPVQIVFNPDWQAGQSTSVQAGLRSLPDAVGAAIYLLVDQPHISKALLQSLIELHAATFSSLVAPQVHGMRANPVLFDRRTFPDLFSLQGDVGGRQLFSHHRAAWLPWHDQALTLDIDVPEDYRRLLEV